MEKEQRSVRYSDQFFQDIADIYLYGYETFGKQQADKYEERIYALVNSLYFLYDLYPECKHIPTKNHIYRNVILESHLILYRITLEKIEVLRIIHSRSSITKIRSTRNIKL